MVSLYALLACAPPAPTPPAAAPPPAAPTVSGPRTFLPVALDPITPSPSADVLGRAITVRAGSLVENGTTRPLLFQRIDTPAGFGAIVDSRGKPTGRTCGNPDFNAFFPGVMLTHFECGPGVLYRSEVDANLRVIQTAPVDFSTFGGGFQHCAGSRTPWGTLLSSEEYEPDAHVVDRFLATHPTPKPEEWPKELTYHGYSETPGYHGAGPIPAYKVGWTPEVTPAGVVLQHYALGRFSHELGVVLPDRRTVYLTDDAAFGGLFRFVADQPDDLSSGRLYAMKVEGDVHSLDRTLRWIELGHARDAEIRTDLAFDALFTRADLSPTGTCAAGLLRVENNGAPECLMVKPGMETQASRLETRRYAELLGASLEFSKEEGVAYDTAQNRLYVVVSAVTKGMGATPGARQDDLQLAPNRCGAILRLDLDDTYAGTSMRPLLVGVENVEGGVASCEGVANPDNIAILEPRDIRRGGPPGQLLIGEDTRLRPNPRLWALDLAGSAPPVPILVGPLGAEVTGLHSWDVGGRRFIGVTLQHVGDTDDLAGMPAPYPAALQGAVVSSWLGILPL